MPTSPILLFNHITQGQLQKEVAANEAMNILERKIVNAAEIDAAGTGDLTLTADQTRDAYLEFTGLLAGNRNIILPARNMFYMVMNNTTGNFTLSIKVTGGATVLLGRGMSFWIWCDGVDCFDMTRVLLDSVVAVSTTYQATAFDRVINADTTGGGFTITLPQATPGRTVLIQSTGHANTLTVARGGSDTINGAATSLTINAQYQALYFVAESATSWVASRRTSTVLGTGDVVGPASAVDNDVCLFDSTTGKLIKSAGVGLATKAGVTTGTFTPTLAFGGGTTGIAYTTQQGRYTRLHNLVMISLFIQLSNKGSSTGNASISIPFTALAGDTMNGSVEVAGAFNLTGLTSKPSSLILTSATVMSLLHWGATGHSALTDANFTNTSFLYMNGFYRASTSV